MSHDETSVSYIIQAHRRQVDLANAVLHLKNSPPLFFVNNRDLLTKNNEDDSSDSDEGDHIVDVENELRRDSELVKKARNNANIQTLFNDMGVELLNRSNNMSNRYSSKCSKYKIGDKLLKFLMWILALAAAAMSINGIQAVTSQDVEETLIFIGGIIIFLVPIVNEIREQLDLGRRSKKFLKYHHRFQELCTEIRKVACTCTDPVEGLAEFSDIERQINELDQKAFDVILNIRNKSEENQQPLTFLNEKKLSN